MYFKSKKYTKSRKYRLKNIFREKEGKLIRWQPSIKTRCLIIFSNPLKKVNIEIF